MASQPEPAKEKPHEFSPLKIAFFTGLGSMVGDMLMYPFDTVGTRIKANTEQFLSFRQGYNQIVRKEGFMMLYKGFSTTVFGSFIPYGTYFLVYEYLNSWAVKATAKLDSERYKHINLLIPLITAPLAECACVATYIPFDTIRTRMQMNSPDFAYKGIMHGMSEIRKHEGIIRLFQASHLYIVSMIVYTSLQFWMYEMFRYWYLSRRHKNEEVKKLKFSESITATLVSTAFATFVSNPLDVLITRFQLVDSRKQQLSSYKLVRDLLVNEGKKSVFKGLGTRTIQYTTFSLFYLPVYDHVKAKYGITLDS